MEFYHISVSHNATRITPRYGEFIKKKVDWWEHYSEMVFEEVRKKYFPEKPSRLKSVYATRSIEESNKMAARIRRYCDTTTYLVKPSNEGRIHIGDMRWLDCKRLPFESVMEYAKNYWKGLEDANNPYIEVLLEGSWDIIKKISFRERDQYESKERYLLV